jgi:hypothetical protein
VPAPDPAAQAHSVLVTKLAVVPPNRIVGGYADEADLESRALHLMDIARIVDAYILALGCDVRENMSEPIDLADFTDQLTAALEGNATYQLTKAAQRIREARYPSAHSGMLP